MKKIMLLIILTLSSMPIASLAMMPFVTSTLGKRTLLYMSALVASQTNSFVGRDYVEENLPKIPPHPKYPYNEEGIAFEQLCSQAPSINDKTSDFDKEEEARLLAQKLYNMLPGSGTINLLGANTKNSGGTYPFESSPRDFWVFPGRWNDYRYSIKKDAPWYNTSSKPLKPEEIYETQIPGEQQISEVQATLVKLSEQSFKPARQRFERSLERISTALQEEESKYFWQRDERKIRSLKWDIEQEQRFIKKCAFLSSSQEELEALKAAAHVRQNFLQQHMTNHFEWEKEKEKVEKKREEIRKFAQEKEEIFKNIDTML